MKLSRKIKARMCGGCRGTHIARVELEEWIADAEVLETGMQFVDEKNARIEAENTRLREAIREIADAAEMHSTHVDDDWCAVSAICARALTEEENDDER